MATKKTGLDEVLKNLNSEIKKIDGATLAGLWAGGLIVQRDAQQRVPVEHGFLKASAYTRRAIDKSVSVEVGFSSEYAEAVHERIEQKLEGKARPSGLGVYWGPHGESQFLLKAVIDKKDEILKQIRKRVKLK